MLYEGKLILYNDIHVIFDCGLILYFQQEFIIYIERESIQRSIALSKGTALKCYAISSIRLRRERPVDRC